MTQRLAGIGFRALLMSCHVFLAAAKCSSCTAAGKAAAQCGYSVCLSTVLLCCLKAAQAGAAIALLTAQFGAPCAPPQQSNMLHPGLGWCIEALGFCLQQCLLGCNVCRWLAFPHGVYRPPVTAHTVCGAHMPLGRA